jgi:CelD/BcsL family acetyltransferase involved in cellulose biosynthesis
MPALQSEIGCSALPANHGAPISVQLCATWPELEAFRADWDHLLQVCSYASIFQTPEWLGAWWAAFGADKELKSLVFLAPGGETVGLAPLYIEEQRFFLLSLKILRMVGAGSTDSDALDFIIAPGYEEACANAFLSWLNADRRCDICALETLPGNSQVAQEISALTEGRGKPVYSETTPNFFIDLPPSWPEYLQKLEPGFRPLLTRYPRRLQSRYAVLIARCEREEKLDSALQTLFALHQMRWTGRGKPGAFSVSRRRDFYSRMARAFLQRGWLEFWLLKLDQETVAAQFCFRYGKTVCLLQEGFNPAYTADKVGYALRARVLEEMIRTGAERYDFLGGADAYKLKFGAEQGRYLTMRFAGASWRGRLCLAWQYGKQKGKQWLKRRLPARALATLRPRQDAIGGRKKEATE